MGHRQARTVWYISDFQLLKLPGVKLTLGPFEAYTRDLARLGWQAKFEQNLFTFSCRMLFIHPMMDDSYVHYSVKWKEYRVFKEVTEAWNSFIIVCDSVYSGGHRQEMTQNLKFNPHVVWANKSSKDPTRLFIEQRGAENILRTMNDMTKENLGAWRPSRKHEEPPEVIPGRNAWLEEHMLDD